MVAKIPMTISMRLNKTLIKIVLNLMKFNIQTFFRLKEQRKKRTSYCKHSINDKHINKSEKKIK